VAEIIINNNFLFLSQNPATLSLFSTQKRTENEKNKVWYQNSIFENYMDMLLELKRMGDKNELLK
jgi:hypothetical protein